MSEEARSTAELIVECLENEGVTMSSGFRARRTSG